jgi:hypothetical protein
VAFLQSDCSMATLLQSAASRLAARDERAGVMLER